MGDWVYHILMIYLIRELYYHQKSHDIYSRLKGTSYDIWPKHSMPFRIYFHLGHLPIITSILDKLWTFYVKQHIIFNAMLFLFITKVSFFFIIRILPENTCKKWNREKNQEKKYTKNLETFNGNRNGEQNTKNLLSKEINKIRTFSCGKRIGLQEKCWSYFSIKFKLYGTYKAINAHLNIESHVWRVRVFFFYRGFRPTYMSFWSCLIDSS